MWTKVGLGIRVGGQRNKTAQPTCNLGIKHQRLQVLSESRRVQVGVTVQNCKVHH